MNLNFDKNKSDPKVFVPEPQYFEVKNINYRISLYCIIFPFVRSVTNVKCANNGCVWFFSCDKKLIKKSVGFNLKKEVCKFCM